MRVALATVLCLFATSVAAAQLCAGDVAFGLSHIDVSANVGIDKHAHRYTGEFRSGYRHAFAALEYGIKTWEATTFDGESRAIGVTLGLEMAGRPGSKVGLCWLVSYASLSGPHQIDGSVWSFAEHSYTAGLSLGYVAARRQLWDIVPTAAFTVGTTNPRLTTDSGGSMAQYQEFCCGWQTFASLRLGVGLGFSDELTLTPELALPLGDVGVKAYGIRGAVRLGKGI